MSTYRGGSLYTNFVGTFTTASATFVDLLDNAGGSTITTSFTKSAGTSILAYGGVPFFATGTNAVCYLGVNDGTTDWELGRGFALTTSARRGQTIGAVLITGLGAGTFTLKARVRTHGAGTLNFNTNESVSMSFVEVGTGFANAQVLTRLCTSVVTYNSTSTVDVLDAPAGNTVDVTLTKASAGNKILVFGRANFIYSGGGAGVPTLKVYDGTTATNIARGGAINTSNYNDAVGMVLLTGHSAGSVNLKLQVAGSDADSFITGATSSSMTIWAMEVP